MESTSSWINNKAAQKYFTDTWKKVKEKWVQVFFSSEFLFKITMNNGAESQNKLLKYSYLKQYCNKSMTLVIEVIIQEFSTDAIRKYTLSNSRLNSQFKSYNKQIPSYLLDRPLFFIQHVYKRLLTARNEYTSNMIHNVEVDKFVVKSENSQLWYAIDFSKPSCTCDDFYKWRSPCKHLCAIFLCVPGKTFVDLPKAYLDNPFLNVDEDFNVFCNSVPTSSKNPEVLNTIPTTSNVVNEEMLVDTELEPEIQS